MSTTTVSTIEQIVAYNDQLSVGDTVNVELAGVLQPATIERTVQGCKLATVRLHDGTRAAVTDWELFKWNGAAA